MKAAGVTTVDPVRGPGHERGPDGARRSRQEWFPEWFYTGSGYDDLPVLAQATPDEQAEHAFGISLIGPYFEYPPDLSCRSPGSTVRTTGTGAQASAPTGVVPSGLTWILAGMHYAGPDLNVKNFKQGLFAAPPTGGDPKNPLATLSGYGRTTGLPYDAYTPRSGRLRGVLHGPAHHRDLARHGHVGRARVLLPERRTAVPRGPVAEEHQVVRQVDLDQRAGLVPGRRPASSRHRRAHGCARRRVRPHRRRARSRQHVLDPADARSGWIDRGPRRHPRRCASPNRGAVVADPFGNRLVLVDLSKGAYTTDADGSVTGVERTSEETQNCRSALTRSRLRGQVVHHGRGDLPPLGRPGVVAHAGHHDEAPVGDRVGDGPPVGHGQDPVTVAVHHEDRAVHAGQGPELTPLAAERRRLVPLGGVRSGGRALRRVLELRPHPGAVVVGGRAHRPEQRGLGVVAVREEVVTHPGLGIEAHGRHEHRAPDAVPVAHRQIGEQEPTHREADHVAPVRPGRVEHRDRVVRHVGQRVPGAAVTRSPGVAGIEADHRVPGGDQRVDEAARVHVGRVAAAGHEQHRRPRTDALPPELHVGSSARRHRRRGSARRRATARSGVEDDGLGLEEREQPLLAALAADARLLEAAERDAEVGAERVVADGAGAQLAGDRRGRGRRRW